MVKQVGLAFSGGGVRSAAFSSGVLRRILQQSLPMDYLSSVSGGGYTASAYFDWKFRHEMQDDPEWHKRFFDHMRKRIGFYTNWNNPLIGFLDSVLLFCFALLIAVVLPIVNWFPLAIPVAYLVDLCFGDILRGDFTCGRNNTSNAINSSNQKECTPLNLPIPMKRTELLFVILIVLTIVLGIFNTFILPKYKLLGKFFQNLFGFTFLMVLLPWLLEQYLSVTPWWINLLVFALTAAIWLGFPPLRSIANLVLIFYFYAYAVKWRVFKTPVIGLDYTTKTFAAAMWVSGLVMWFAPFLGAIQQGAVNRFIRWRLQKAFYTRESVGRSGCYGIECHAFLPSSKCCQSYDGERLIRALTLGDLEGMKPEWICNVLVDSWQWSSDVHVDRPNYELLTLTPSAIGRLDCAEPIWARKQFADLTPDDIKLSDAMATSAAAISTHMGKFQDKMELFRNLQVILGISGGRSLNVNPRKKSLPIFPILVQLMLVLPIILFPFVQWIPPSMKETAATVIGVWFGVVLLVLSAVAVMPTGAKDPTMLERLVRWCIVNVYHVRFLREMFNVTNVGPISPPILSLSDGGHVENLGLLSLFQRRVEKIVVVDGGFYKRSCDYASSLLATLELARKKLHCSFAGIEGRDIAEDVREKFVETSYGKQPRFYRFKVEYYQRSSSTSPGTKVGEGEVLLLTRRHPDKGTLVTADQRKTWNGYGLDLDFETWGIGPELEAWEVDNLAGCCCECCHCAPCGCLFNPLCGVFPNHATANLFITPAMFTAYHREGYRACVEAAVDQFLEDDITRCGEQAIDVQPV